MVVTKLVAARHLGGLDKKAVTAGDTALFAVGEDGSLSVRQGVKSVSVVCFVCVWGGRIVWLCVVVCFM